MLRSVKIFVGVVIGALALQHAHAFSFWGPAETWQTAALDFGYGELGGPKNLGEEWRINTPTITYGFDPSFLDYFGNDGVKAVDNAMKLMNSLPQVSSMRSDLSEYPTEGNQRINYRAQALYLIDMKSAMMNVLVEHLGLAGERHVFDLRQKIAPAGAPPCVFEYSIINWNFDPVTWEPTHYVNGIRYSFEIIDDCPVRDLADAMEYTVDSVGIPFSAVSSQETLVNSGMFFLGLTRDDVGGLRYLYRRNNYNNEFLPADAVAQNVLSGQNTAWNVPSFWNTNTTTANGQTNNTGTTATNTASLRGGIEKITFVKMQYQSTLDNNQFRQVVINYTVPTVVNSKVVNQKVQRVINRPDILIAAADLGPDTPESTATALLRRSWGQVGTSVQTGNNTQNNATNGTYALSGPGVFQPQMIVTFNKLGPYYYTTGLGNNYYLNEKSSGKGFLWGSFDGSTNAPVVFPSGTSIKNLEWQVLGAPISTNLPGVSGGSITFDPVVVAVQTNNANATGGQ